MEKELSFKEWMFDNGFYKCYVNNVWMFENEIISGKILNEKLKEYNKYNKK